jgi:hypothetical protein
LALLCSGYTAYQVFTLQQTLNVASVGNRNATTSTQKTPSSETSTAPPENKPSSQETPAFSSSTTTAQSTTSTGSAIKPGEFVQPSFGRKAEVELLSLKRIKDPETGNRDVVNLQMRIRRVATDGINPGESVGVYNTTARNPDTSETYKGINLKRSTGSVELFSLRPQASADAYVWLRIPEGVNSIDVFVPDTAAFKNVPVSN